MVYDLVQSLGKETIMDCVCDLLHHCKHVVDDGGELLLLLLGVDAFHNRVLLLVVPSRAIHDGIKVSINLLFDVSLVVTVVNQYKILDVLQVVLLDCEIIEDFVYCPAELVKR